MDEFGQRLNDPISPFNEGAHLNLICEAEGGMFVTTKKNFKKIQKKVSTTIIVIVIVIIIILLYY